MSIIETFTEVWTHSGLFDLARTVASWLALDARQLIFVIATPVFIGVALWEYFRIRHDSKLMDAREAILNFTLGAGYQISELLFAGVIAFPVYALAYRHRLFDISWSWFVGIVLYIAVDFAYYFFHLASHRIRWFWCAHVTHHSSERLNFSTAMRQNATNIFNGGWLVYVPLALLGFNPVWIGMCYALNLVYQFFIHSTLVPKLHPAIEFIFNTPSHHRAHHGRNPRYIDRNYAGTLIVWDRLFGTFVEESKDEPPEYGIVNQVHTRNLFVSWLHEYRDLLRDIAQPGPFFQRIRHVWKAPEWTRSLTGSLKNGETPRRVS